MGAGTMDTALQRALLESFQAAPRVAAPSYNRGGHVTVTRTVTRPNGSSSTSRMTRSYGGAAGGSSSGYGQRASRPTSSFHARAAPVVRSGGGRTFDSYRTETARRHHTRRPDTNGRFNRLERDGIRPTPTSGRHAGASRSKNASGRASGASSSASGGRSKAGRSSRRIPVPKRRVLADQGETFRPLGSGWVERTMDGEWIRSGLHTQMEADTPSWYGVLCLVCRADGSPTHPAPLSHFRYIATYEPTSTSAQPGVAAVEEGQVNIEIAVKSVRPTDAGPDPASAFHIVVGYRGPSDFYMVVGDVRAQEWRVQHVDGTVVSRVADTSMKQDIFFNLVILVRGDKISVDANGTSVFGRVMLPEGGLKGDIGVACCDSKLVFKSLRLSPAPGSKAARMVAATSPRATVDTGRGNGGSASGSNDVVVRAGGSSHRGPSRMHVKTVGGAGSGGSSSRRVVSTGSRRGERKHEDRPVRTPPSSIPTDRPRYTDDDPRLIEMIERNVLECDIGVTFKDIAALDDAKRLLNEAVVLPLLVPEFFTGIREPWKGVLLFGPPGNALPMSCCFYAA